MWWSSNTAAARVRVISAGEGENFSSDSATPRLRPSTLMMPLFFNRSKWRTSRRAWSRTDDVKRTDVDVENNCENVSSKHFPHALNSQLLLHADAYMFGSQKCNTSNIWWCSTLQIADGATIGYYTFGFGASGILVSSTRSNWIAIQFIQQPSSLQLNCKDLAHKI